MVVKISVHRFYPSFSEIICVFKQYVVVSSSNGY